MLTKFLTGAAWTFGVLFILNFYANATSKTKTAKDKSMECTFSLFAIAACAAWLLARYVL